MQVLAAPLGTALPWMGHPACPTEELAKVGLDLPLMATPLLQKLSGCWWSHKKVSSVPPWVCCERPLPLGGI